MSKTGGILMDVEPIDVEDDKDALFDHDVKAYVESPDETNSFEKEHQIDMLMIDHSTLKF